VGGVAGAVAIGAVSDRFRRSSRSVVAAAGLVGLAAALLLYARLAPVEVLAQASLMSLIGALLFGPDSLLSGAAAQDAGGVASAARATGFVNGLGSIGALLQGYVTVWVRNAFGWSAVFYLFVAFALAAAAALAPTFRFRTAPGAVGA
jgi:sugar phosphate permease